jgi:hypothetical protein
MCIEPRIRTFVFGKCQYIGAFYRGYGDKTANFVSTDAQLATCGHTCPPVATTLQFWNSITGWRKTSVPKVAARKHPRAHDMPQNPRAGGAFIVAFVFIALTLPRVPMQPLAWTRSVSARRTISI